MVNLGWLQPENFLGGAMELRPELARRAFQPLAEALGMTVEEASMGAIQIASHSMVQSIEENSVRKGFDPRDFALVAEGGAGPMFAANIAAEVGTPAVIVPPYPGVTAALGLLVTDTVYEYVTTTYQRMSQLNAAELQARFEELEAQAREQLERDGIPHDRWVIQRVADCRYLGQGYELRVEAGSGELDDAWAANLAAQFHDAHEREYSRRFEESDIEIPNIRVRGIGLIEPLQMREVARAGEWPAAALRHEREAWFRVESELRELPTKFYDRGLLVAGNRVDGPAVINQYDTTTVIPPGLTAEIDRFGNIVIWIDQSAQTAAVGATDVATA
jgi:N-methylhydantoinase A/oxoprolinase/acetone carboxylase beta subunit